MAKSEDSSSAELEDSGGEVTNTLLCSRCEASSGVNSPAELHFSSSGEAMSYLPGGASNGFKAKNGSKAKLDELSLSGEATPLGSCDAKC